MAKDRSLKANEDLIHVGHEKHDSMSKSYQSIAMYLTQNPFVSALKPAARLGQPCSPQTISNTTPLVRMKQP